MADWHGMGHLYNPVASFVRYGLKYSAYCVVRRDAIVIIVKGCSRQLLWKRRMTSTQSSIKPYRGERAGILGRIELHGWLL